MDEVIAGATDSGVSTSNLLRKVLVLGRRLKSPELAEWTNGELNGFNGRPLEDFPSYRGPLTIPVQVEFAGPQGFSVKHYISEESVPNDGGFRDAQFRLYLDQPLAELETLSQADRDLMQAWPSRAVGQFQKWGAEGKAPSVPYCGVFSAHKVITRAMLEGVVHTVRNKALDLALDLQDHFPDAGEVNGPSIQDPEVRNIVNNYYQANIHGGTNTVGMGENVTQNVTVSQGDTAGLMDALERLGLAKADQEHLLAAIEQDKKDGNGPGNAVWAFLGKVGAGVVRFGGEIAKPYVAAAVKTAFSGFFGVPIA